MYTFTSFGVWNEEYKAFLLSNTIALFSDSFDCYIDLFAFTYRRRHLPI